MLLDKFAQPFHVLNRSFGKDAVTKIEDVAGAAGGLGQNVARSGFEFFPFREQKNWIQISLHCTSVLKQPPTFVEWDTPIEADDFCASFLH